MKKIAIPLSFLALILISCFIIGEVLIRALYKHFFDYDMEMRRYAKDLF